MKAFVLTFIGGMFLAAVALTAYRQFTHKNQVHIAQEYNPPMTWIKDIIRADGCKVTYTWYDPTGDYPFTKDTCCLDSIVWDDFGAKQYWAYYRIDSITGQKYVEVVEDSIISPN